MVKRKHKLKFWPKDYLHLRLNKTIDKTSSIPLEQSPLYQLLCAITASLNFGYNYVQSHMSAKVEWSISAECFLQSQWWYQYDLWWIFGQQVYCSVQLFSSEILIKHLCSSLSFILASFWVLFTLTLVYFTPLPSCDILFINMATCSPYTHLLLSLPNSTVTAKKYAFLL